MKQDHFLFGSYTYPAYTVLVLPHVDILALKPTRQALLFRTASDISLDPAEGL